MLWNKNHNNQTQPTRISLGTFFVSVQRILISIDRIFLEKKEKPQGKFIFTALNKQDTGSS